LEINFLTASLEETFVFVFYNRTQSNKALPHRDAF